MSAAIVWLEGKKTYFCLLALGIIKVLVDTNAVVYTNAWKAAVGIIALLGGAAVSSKANRAIKAVKASKVVAKK